MDRWVLHCDCNSFYASVELLDHPHLRDKPVAVCGDPESRHGIILAKNEAAKAFGVTTAETVWQALRKCPDLVLLAPSRKKYLHYSKIINTIYNEYTDLVEPFGIDESWLDVSGSYSLFAPSPRALAHLLRQRIKEETGLTISVGVSFNKVFAKLGSDYKKPDAVTVISRLNYRQLVWPMPASALLYVGRRVQDQLHRLGIDTIGQLAAADPAVLESSLGKLGGDCKLSRGKPSPRWFSSKGFRYGFLIFFLAMFGSMLLQTYMVASGAASLKEAIKLFWTLRVPWDWAYAAGSLPAWAAQFSFGFYSLMLTSTLIGLIVMVLYRPRSWCAFCPMGTMTQSICKLKNRAG